MWIPSLSTILLLSNAQSPRLFVYKENEGIDKMESYVEIGVECVDCEVHSVCNVCSSVGAKVGVECVEK